MNKAEKAEYMALYRVTHRDAIRAQRAGYRAVHRAKRLAQLVAWKQTESGRAAAKRTYEKAKSSGAKTARQMVYAAVRDGKLTKLPCRVCGADQVQAHHPNGYVGPARYDVDWLCRPHHEVAHHGAIEAEMAYAAGR